MGITFTALCHRLVGRGAFNHGDCNGDMSWVAVDGQLLHRAPVSAFVPAVCRTCPISVPIVSYLSPSDGGIIKKGDTGSGHRELGPQFVDHESGCVHALL